jgi:hypothetical protein
MQAPDLPVRIRLLGALVLVGVFAAGAVFGVGLTRWSHAGEPAGRPPRRPPPGGPVEAMIHELQLDPAQIDALRGIERVHRPELDAIARETMPRVRGVLDAMERELLPRLRPAQVELLEAWRKRRPPPGMPGPGGPGGFGGPPPGGPGARPPPDEE